MSNIRMTEKEIRELLKRTGAIRTGHFKLTSGRHSDTYIQCARVLEYPTLTMQLADEAVAKLPEDLQVDIVASPALGGILFGFAVATALDTTMIYSERVDGTMVFRRSFEVPEGARILVVEDVVTTGGSVREVCDLVEAEGGVVVGVVSMIDRADSICFDAPYYPLLRIKAPSWQPEDCTLCAQGVKITSPGSRNLK